jgi:glyoxylase-like metal-dependent hydrolase (beta-lactamase superfamily II)
MTIVQQKRTSLPENLWPVAESVVGLTTGIVNLYFVGEPEASDRGWVMIDAGMPLSTQKIMHAVRARFGEARPAAILLTHGHFDHIGALGELAKLWDVPIYCHSAEAPFLNGRLAYPPADASLPGWMAFSARLFPRGPKDFSGRLEILPNDGSVPFLADWQVIETPGHSPGHVSFFREQDRMLIAGDAFVAVAQESVLSILRQDGKVHRPPPYFTPDWDSARSSVEKLAALKPKIAATGHGPILQGEILEQGLDTLIEDWQRDAVPVNGRYSKRAPIIQSNRITNVPPAKFDYRLLVAAGLGMWSMLRLCNAKNPLPWG